MNENGEARVRLLVRAARRLADPSDPIGIEARRVLPKSTGLSPEGVALALERCLETHPSDAEIRALCSSVEPAPRALVLLSATVFTGVHRAAALALAASSRVLVRPSRREPEAARLLRAAAGNLFECVDELKPEPGDHLWAYGSDATMESLRQSLPERVTVHAHGAGLGVAVVDADLPGNILDDAVRGLVEDVIVFDQRGCLSPRIVFVRGPESKVVEFAVRTSRALADAERRVPVGVRTPEERAAIARYRETMRFGGRVLEAGSGCIGMDVESGNVLVPPAGRHLHIVRFTTIADAVAPARRWTTAVGIAGDDALYADVRDALPWARPSALGSMQQPPFDGPVDRRPSLG